MANIQLINETKKNFLELLASKKSGGSISMASSLVGISRQTIYDWRKDDSDFDQGIIDAMREGKTQIADLAEQALVKRIEAGDTTAVIFTLKTLRSNRYGDKDERREEEKRVNEKSPQARQIETPERFLLYFNMVIWNLEHLAKEAEVYTPEIEEMFKRIKNPKSGQKDDKINEDDKSQMKM